MKRKLIKAFVHLSFFLFVIFEINLYINKVLYKNFRVIVLKNVKDT